MFRTMRRSTALASAMVIALAAAWGCDDGTPSVSQSNEEAVVKGTVKVNGQPLDDGEITFDPTNVHRKFVELRTAKVKAGGYEVTTLVGGNSITVRSKAIDRDPGLASNSKYVEIEPGENTVDIEVP